MKLIVSSILRPELTQISQAITAPYLSTSLVYNLFTGEQKTRNQKLMVKIIIHIIITYELIIT
jgi:hypothetical protein